MAFHADESLSMSADTIKVTAHRLRQRSQELLRNEIAQTVAQSGDVDDEIRDLSQILAAR